jgi:O-antigen ligase
MAATARRRAIPASVSAWIPTVAGLVGGVLLMLVAYRFGSMVLVALVAAAAATVLLSRPTLAVAIPVVLIVVLEDDPTSLLHGPSQLYGYLPGFKVTGVEALLGLAAAAVALDATSRRRMRLPEPFTVPLLLIVLALVAGAITGRSAGSDWITISENARVVLLVVVAAFLVANVIRDRRDLLRWIAGIAALAIFKGAVGAGSVLIGKGVLIDDNGTVGTYLQSTANFLAMLFLAAVAAAALARGRLPAWVWWGAPLVLAALVLSFRRSFWIATVAALIIVLVVASGRVGRRMIVPAAVVVGLLGWLLVGTGVGGQLQGPVVERAESLDPSKVRRNDQDRYRLSERRNVVLALREQPITGLGLGQNWTARRPMPLEHPGGHSYVHFAALWWWMKCGLLGFVAYVALMATAIVAGLQIARREPDVRIRVAALGAGAAFIGLAVAELTATFTGSEVRTTVLVGVLLGVLAAARALMRPGDDGLSAGSR